MKIFATLLITAVLGFGFVPPASAATHPMEVWGHRAWRAGGITENTYAAYEAARKAGAHGIEVDLRRTRTGYWVIQHDASMSRTSKNCDQLVSDISYTKFRKCKPNSGSHFMSLKNTAKWAAKYKMYVDLDVKVWMNDEYAAQIRKIIADQKATKYFMPNGVNTSAFLNGNGLNGAVACPTGVCGGSGWTKVNTIKVDAALVKDKDIQYLHWRKKSIIAYNVKLDQIPQLSKRGIDGIMVDRPKDAVKAVNKIRS